jgi:DNA-binding MarR family transcriptional regulator
MPDANECAKLLLDTIPGLMRALHENMRQCRNDEDEQPNMGQLRMLALLNESPRALRDLAANHHVTPSTMSRTIDVLVRKGWVLRVADLVDRRQVILMLTDEGRAALRGMGQHSLAVVTGMLGRLDEDERARLYDGLAVLRKLLAAGE